MSLGMAIFPLFALRGFSPLRKGGGVGMGQDFSPTSLAGAGMV